MENEKDDIEMHHQANYRLFEFAKKMRWNPTEAEKILWNALKGKQLKGYKFRRQHPIGSFILDFYCHNAKLAIELDGEYHEKEEQKKYDQLRTKTIQEVGITELRFRNEEIMNNLEKVLTKIENYLKSK